MDRLTARSATVVLTGLTLLALAGCVATPLAAPAATRTAGSAGSAAPAELRVSAATSLKAPFEAIAPAFEKATGAKVRFDFSASGVLQKRIEGGAPSDVFASASPKQVDALIADGIVSPDATATFAGNDLVIFVAEGDPAGIDGPGDLAKAKRLTTGDPSAAPHGAEVKEWLTRLGIWDELRPRFVFAENAAQTLEYVVRGEVDAGIGFASEAKRGDKVEVVYTVPQDEIDPIRYVIAPVKSTRQPGLAREFIDFVLSAEGQRALAGAGFLPAPTAAP